MPKLSSIFCLIFLVFLSFAKADEFGFLSYSTGNIGDDIQMIAAKRFLPKDSIFINRDTFSLFHCTAKVHAIMNGWYMHTKNAGWPFAGQPPQKSWPPSPSIDPLFVSVHFGRFFLNEVFSKEGISYLQQHAPIGARDYFTLRELTKRNIPSYFSGCLTLTLENDAKEREDVIYVVDLDQRIFNYIKSKANCRVESISHVMDRKMWLDPEERSKFANSLLEKYKRARCVITSKLHVAMPCLAFETPVLLMNTQYDQERFEGLKELVHNCSPYEYFNNQKIYDVNNPPGNPKDYLVLRKQLIDIVTNWVAKNSSVKNANKDLSLHVLIATIGRKSLLDMLQSLQPQLKEQDYLTIVFDGKDGANIYNEVKEYLSQFACTCVLTKEPESMGYWGHGVRNKYNQLAGDFILHGDDDDIYAPDALDIIREECKDRHTVYVFKLKFPDGKEIWKDQSIELGNIGTPMGVIPSEYMKCHWGHRYGGDFDYYDSLQRRIPNVVFVDKVIYLIRPTP